MRRSIIQIFFSITTFLISYELKAQNKIIDSLLTELKLSKENNNKVSLLNEISWQYEEQRKADQQLKYANMALELSEKLNDIKGKARANFILGLYYENRNNEEAVKCYNRSIQNYEYLKDKEGVAKSLEGLSYVYFYSLKKKEEGIDYMKKALLLSQELGDKKLEAFLNQSLGLFYFEEQKYPESLKYYMASLKIAENLDNKELLSICYNQLGLIYNRIGNLSEALKYFLLEAKVDGYTNSNVYIIYREMGYYDEVLKLYLDQLDKYRKEGKLKPIPGLQITIGTVYFEKGEYEKAKNYLLSGIKDYSSRDSIGLISGYLGLSDVYLKMAGVLKSQNQNRSETCKMVDMALDNSLIALKISEKIKSDGSIANCNLAIGKVYNEKAKCSINNEKDYTTSIAYLKAALSLLKANRIRLPDVYLPLAEAYYNLKNYELSFRYYSLTLAIKDSIFNDESSKKIEQLRTQRQVELAITEEKSRQEKVQAEMQFAFIRREDSLKFQQSLTLASLDLSNKQKDINKLAFLNSQAELEAEQSRRKDKEQQLTISEQEKALQNNQLTIQQAELNLKESQIQAEKKQRLFYIGGIILLLMLFVFIYHSIQNRQRSERLVAAERLKTEKANAAHKMTELEMQSLRAQLNPHFMFNSLNAIQELILKEDNDNSHLYLSRFSELLRMLLDNANQPFVSLRKEISLLELYLSLENLRIPDLKYTIEIDPRIDSNRIAIPNMMLQPYIENAIWHGLSHKKGERNLNIRISRKEDNIVCEVEDNGVGRKMSAELKSLYRREHRSRGMELLSKRFNLLSKEYGSEIQTTIEDLYNNGTATGTRVAITVPYSLTEQAKPVYS